MSKLTGTRRPADTDISQQYPSPVHLRYDFSDPNTRQQIIGAFSANSAVGRLAAFLKFGEELLRLRDTLNWNAFSNASRSDVAALSCFRDAVSAVSVEANQQNKEHAAALFFIFLLNINELSSALSVAAKLSSQLADSLCAFQADGLAKAVPKKENPDAKRTFLGYTRKKAITTVESPFGALQEANNIYILANGDAIDRSLGGGRTVPPCFWILQDYTYQRPGVNSLSVLPSQALKSELVNFFVGPSGSGKTSSAILASGSKSIVIYCLPSSGDFNSNQPINHNEALRRLAILVAQAVVGPDDKSFGPNTQLDAIRLSEKWSNELDDTFSIHVVIDEAVNYPGLTHALCGCWKKSCRDWLAGQFRCKQEKIRLSIVGCGIEKMPQESGSIADTFQTFSISPHRLFPSILEKLATQTLKVDGESPENKENMQLQPIAKLLLKMFFTKTNKNNRDENEKNNKNNNQMMMILPTRNIASNIKTNNTRSSTNNNESGEYFATPRDIVEHRFLQLVSTNARCGTLAIREFALTASSTHWTEATIREHLFTVSLNVMTKFGEMNGLSSIDKRVTATIERASKKEQDPADAERQISEWDARSGSAEHADWIRMLKLDAIGSALKISLTRQGPIDAETWKKYAGWYGIIGDNARWMEEDDCKDDSKWTVVDRAQKPNSDAAAKFYFLAYRKHQPRWVIPEALVAMFLSGFGRSLVATSGFGAAKGKYFETAIADFVYLCWKLEINAPANCETTTFNNKDFTNPRHLFGLMGRAATGNLATCFRGELLESLEEETFIAKARVKGLEWLKKQQEAWRSIIMTGTRPSATNNNNNNHNNNAVRLSQIQFNPNRYGAVVLENHGNAAFADVIAMSPGRLLLIQCKYYHDSKFTSGMAKDGFAAQENCSETLKFLLECCRVGRDVVRIDSVVAGAHCEQFGGDVDLNVHEVDTSNITRVQVFRYLTTAFLKRDGDVGLSSSSQLYPMLQFPLVDRPVHTDSYMLDPLVKLQLKVAQE